MLETDFEPKQIELLLLHGLSPREIIAMVEEYFYPDLLIKLEKMIEEINGKLSETVSYHEIQEFDISIYIDCWISSSESDSTLVNESYLDNGSWADICDQIQKKLDACRKATQSAQVHLGMAILIESENLRFWGSNPDLVEMKDALNMDGFYNFYNCSCGVWDCGASMPGCFVIHRDQMSYFFAPEKSIEDLEGNYVFCINQETLENQFNHLLERVNELVMMKEEFKAFDSKFDVEEQINLQPGFNSIKIKRNMSK